MDSTSRNGSYVQFSTCGFTGWYSFGIPGTNTCTVYNRDIRWMREVRQTGSLAHLPIVMLGGKRQRVIDAIGVSGGHHER